MRQQDVFASAQIISFNPILNESIEIRTQYFVYLKRLIRLVRWDKRKYTKAQIVFYKNKLCGNQESPKIMKEISFDSRFCYLLPYDIVAMLGFHPKASGTEKIKIIINKVVSDFSMLSEQKALILNEFDAALGDAVAWNEVLQSKLTKEFNQYLKLVKKNIDFINKRPYNILITANMSAGKSTLINALVGKNISLMQNMACTSKIHTIISKPFEDGVISEYDHNLSMDASKEELLNDNESNFSSKITVGTFFNSCLGGQRIMLFDSPGVNSSENDQHREISYKMLCSSKYKMLLYVMNATQLATCDEDAYLDVVKKQLGRAKVLFVMNKIDYLNSEDDNLSDVIENQRRFLCSKGFKDPIICPVSSRAAYLAKKSQQEDLNLVESFEFQNYISKFERNSMKEYYEKLLNCTVLVDDTNNTTALLRNCGFSYLEQIIEYLSNGGKINGSGLC